MVVMASLERWLRDDAAHKGVRLRCKHFSKTNVRQGLPMQVNLVPAPGPAGPIAQLAPLAPRLARGFNVYGKFIIN